MKIWIVTYLDMYEDRIEDIKLFELEASAYLDYNMPPDSWRIRKDIDVRELN